MTRSIGLISAILTLLVTSPRVGAGEIYDLPRYCDAAALRSDASLRAIAFLNADLGIAVGAYGAMLRTEDGGVTWQPVESTVAHLLDDVVWLDDQRAVAVGGAYDPVTQLTRGVVVFSADGGRRWWRASDVDLPRLRSLRVREDDGTLVAAGDWSAIALSREFESRDGGRTWHPSGELDGPPVIKPEPSTADLVSWIKATRTPIPIRGFCRVRGREGSEQLWAVGDHGVIVRRERPGSDWNVVRGSGHQTAVLVISADPTTVPWPLLGKEALESRNRVALLTVSPRTLPPRPRSADATFAAIDLVRQAAAGVGVSSADAISVETSQQRDAAAAWMAIHRPAVVVIDDSIDQQLRTSFAEAAIAFGAQRVVKFSFDQPGESMLHRNAILPRSGVLGSDLWYDALHLVDPGQPPATSISFRRLYDSAGKAMRGDSLTLGVKLQRGQSLQSAAELASRRQLQIAQARLSHASQLANLFRSTHRGDEFAAGLKQLLDQTAKEDQLRLCWSAYQQLANESAVSDVLGFHDAMLTEFQQRFAGTSIAWYASLRQQSIQRSAEWSKLKSSLATYLDNPTIQTTAVDTVPVSPFQVQQASATAVIRVTDTTPAPAAPPAARSGMIDLNWEFHPLALVAREAARRRGDDDTLQATGEVSANLRRLLDSSAGDWARLLRWEGAQVIQAQATDVRPRLDGQLDEPFWQSALPSAGDQQRIRCAYDEQFVYFAISTPLAELGDDDAPPASDTIRDQDLTPVDRLQISLDTDLDLLSAMQLEFTRSGRTHDSIDGQPQWQPDWFVATRQAGDVAITELAILRRDLVDLPIVGGHSWFVRVRSLPAGEPTAQEFLPRPHQWKRIVFR